MAVGVGVKVSEGRGVGVKVALEEAGAGRVAVGVGNPAGEHAATTMRRWREEKPTRQVWSLSLHRL